MNDLIPVKCRSCGEVNFVPLDRDFVQVGIPIDKYDQVIKLLSKGLPRKPTTRSKVSEEDRQKVLELRAKGFTVRQIMVEMNWSLGKTARLLSGIPKGSL